MPEVHLTVQPGPFASRTWGRAPRNGRALGISLSIAAGGICPRLRIRLNLAVGLSAEDQSILLT